ncbi:MAG TPA: MFS transporter, partial [Candidatus Tumulicola sp.]|nr:MFS transporter [Candidatus Tumulicola sp.]
TARLEWKRANPIGSLKLLRSHHELWALTWMNFATYLAHEVYPNVWAIYCIAVFGWSTGSVGLTLTAVGVLTLINQATLVGPVVAKFGERRVLLASLAVAAGGTALMGTDNGIVFLVAIAIICLPMYNATSQSLMTRRVGPSEQGALQGALGSIRGISMLAGPGIFTVIFAQFVGPWRSAGIPGAPWLLSGAMYAIAFLVAWRATGKADDVVLPLPEPAPPAYVEG